jgi:hypothetical protein
MKKGKRVIRKPVMQEERRGRISEYMYDANNADE